MSKINEIAELINSVPSAELTKEMFELLFTPNELEQLDARYEIVKGLFKKEETQRELAARLKISIAKITRGSNELKRRSSKFTQFMENFFNRKKS